MGLNIVSLGLTEKSIGADALEVVRNSDKIYLESYTVEFPYSVEALEKFLGVKIIPLDRGSVEDESVLDDAKDLDVSLLVYGDALSATTHAQLILSCKKQGIEFNVFHNASILTAVSNSGLSLYRFGKVASMPSWKEHTNRPTSFLNYIKQNVGIGAHSLLLIDIGLDWGDAIEQLKDASEKEGFEFSKVVVISRAGGEEEKIYYGDLKEFGSIAAPYIIIFPSSLSEHEKEFLESIQNP